MLNHCDENLTLSEVFARSKYLMISELNLDLRNTNSEGSSSSLMLIEQGPKVSKFRKFNLFLLIETLCSFVNYISILKIKYLTD